MMLKNDVLLAFKELGWELEGMKSESGM